jgi:hypothetical protein
LLHTCTPIYNWLMGHLRSMASEWADISSSSYLTLESASSRISWVNWM